MENGASTRQLIVAKELQKDLAEIIRSKGVPIVIQYVPTDAEEAY